MKRLLLLLLLPIILSAQTLVRIPGPGGLVASTSGPWAIVSGPTYFSTTPSSCNGTASCSITVASTGTGHLLELSILMFRSTTNQSFVSSISGGGTWVTCSSCTVYNSGQNTITKAYVLSSTPGATTITVNATTTIANWSLGYYELSLSSGTINYDTAGTGTNASCSTTCPGVGLTLSGTRDVIFQDNMPINAVTGISAPYTTVIDWNAAGFASNLNTNSGSAPNWTQSPASTSIVSALAFSNTSSGSAPTSNAQCSGISFGVTSVTCVMSSSVASTNDVLIFAMESTATGTLTISGCGATWTTQTASPSGSNQAISVGTSPTAGPCTITASYSGGASGQISRGAIDVTGTTGTDVIGTLSQTGYITGGSTITGTSVTTTYANDLVISVLLEQSFGSGAFTAGSGFSLTGGVNQHSVGIQIGTQATAGTSNPTATNTDSSAYTRNTVSVHP